LSTRYSTLCFYHSQALLGGARCAARGNACRAAELTPNAAAGIIFSANLSLSFLSAIAIVEVP